MAGVRRHRLLIGNAVGTKTLEHTESGVGESGRADQAIADAAPEHAQEMVLIQSSDATAGDPAFRAVVVDVQRRLAALPDTQNFESPLAPANANQISSDGHSALLRYQIAGNDTEIIGPGQAGRSGRRRRAGGAPGLHAR